MITYLFLGIVLLALLAAAEGMVGAPYRYGGRSPRDFDY